MKCWLWTFVLFCLAAAANTAMAATSYVYTGVNYTSVGGSYTTAMKITGSFTTASPLPANLTNAQIGPGGSNLVTSWSFNDGIQSFTNLNSELLYGQSSFFTISTNATGNITAFNIGFMNPTGTNTVGQPMNAVYFSSIQQAASGLACTTVTAGICTLIPGPSPTTNSASSSTGGTFVITASAVASAPTLTPSLLALLTLALLAFAYLVRRDRV